MILTKKQRKGMNIIIAIASIALLIGALAPAFYALF